MAHRWILGRTVQSNSVIREGAAPRRLERAASSSLHTFFSYQIGLICRRSVVKTQDTAPGMVRRGPRRSRGARKGSLQPREAVRVRGRRTQSNAREEGGAREKRKGRTRKGAGAAINVVRGVVSYFNAAGRNNAAGMRSHLPARAAGERRERQTD